jgi:putative spermidine/putrescine transport system substrate-binding protein
MAMKIYSESQIDQACLRLREILLETRGLERRAFLRVLVKLATGSAVGGSALLSPLATLAAWADTKPMTYFTYGGAWKKAIEAAFGEPFTKKTGIPVRYQEPYNFNKMVAMHQAHAQQIDAVTVSGMEVILAERLGMITPLDWSLIDKSVIDPVQLHRPNVIGGASQSMNVTYSTKKWPGADHPDSWADFWNVEKFPGQRSLRRDALWTIEAAVKADDVKESEFYPIDVDRAFRSLDRIKPHVRTWWTDNSQSQQLLEQEEVDLIHMTNGRATQSILDHKAPFALVWNGATYSGHGEGWIVPTGCPNPTGGMQFLNVVGRAEYQAVFSRMLYYAPQNPKAIGLLDDRVAKLMPSYPDNEKVSHVINFAWWADNIKTVQRRFEEWLQS